MGFSRQEYWGGLPFPSPGYLLDPGIEPGSPTLQANSVPSEPPGNCLKNCQKKKKERRIFLVNGSAPVELVKGSPVLSGIGALRFEHQRP